MTHCPYCGHPATDTSIRKKELSELGYRHEDVRYDCSHCDKTWVHGVPKGEYENEEWQCDSCDGGHYIPHFLFVNLSDKTIRTRPKCNNCFHVPKERIEIEAKFNGENIRGFFGHSMTTGNRDVDSDPI
jgi:DNA-directed RNA polymerase subunit RPC12/RpoP